MNHRLLTEDEKRHNRFQRIRRSTLRSAQRRRDLRLLNSPNPFALFALSGSKVGLQGIGFFVSSHSIFHSARWQKACFDAVPAPSRTLWRRNRGAMPIAYLESPQLGEPVGADKAFALASSLMSKLPPSAVLFFLSQPEAIGLPLTQIARIAPTFGMDFGASAVDEAAASVRFYETIRAGEGAFEFLTGQRRTNDWCSFAWEQLQDLLPGLRVRPVFRRQHYLVRLQKDHNKIVALDFCSLRLRPLFRVPLTSRGRHQVNTFCFTFSKAPGSRSRKYSNVGSPMKSGE